MSSGKIVHPHGGHLNPGNGTTLVYHSDRHAAALFAFDEDDERIMHRDGKIWHPHGGSPNPSNGTACVLHSDVHDAAKFYFGNLDGTEISPYPNPNLSGTWEVIKAFIAPKASHTFTKNLQSWKGAETIVDRTSCLESLRGGCQRYFQGQCRIFWLC